MRKKMKSHKGMTLIEMIISLAIFAIMCGILVGVGIHIDQTSRATNNLKNKVAVQSPIAANKVLKDSGGNDLFDASKGDITDLTITYEINDDPHSTGGASYTYNVYDKATKKTSSKTSKAHCEIDVQKYNTERIASGRTDAYADADEEAKAKAAANGLLDLEFILPVSSTSTSTSTTTTTTTTTTP